MVMQIPIPKMGFEKSEELGWARRELVAAKHGLLVEVRYASELLPRKKHP